MKNNHNKKQFYWNHILTYAALSFGLLLFHTLWDNALIGLIVGLILFFLILDREQITLFKHLSQFKFRNLWYLLPVLLEWLIAFPLQFWVLGTTNWDILSNVGTQTILIAIPTQLLSNFREEIATSFCWLMIAFLVMHLLKVTQLKKTHLKTTIVILALLFAMLHYSNVILFATHPTLDLATKIFGAALVLVNAFILGLYFKIAYLKTRSIQTVLIIHFVCGLRRSLFPITNPNTALITLQQIGLESLILLLYLAATLVIWRKKWDLTDLNQVYDQIADPLA